LRCPLPSCFAHFSTFFFFPPFRRSFNTACPPPGICRALKMKNLHFPRLTAIFRLLLNTFPVFLPWHNLSSVIFGGLAFSSPCPSFLYLKRDFVPSTPPDFPPLIPLPQTEAAAHRLPPVYSFLGSKEFSDPPRVSRPGLSNGELD